MGKIKRNKLSARGDAFRSSEDVASQITRDRYAGQSSGRGKAKTIEDDEAVTIVDQNLSIKILKQAKKQRDELEDEMAEAEVDDDVPSSSKTRSNAVDLLNDDDFPTLGGTGDDDGADADSYDYDDHVDELELDADDEAAFEKFMPTGGEKLRTLADIIQDKINERQTEMSTNLSDNGGVQMSSLDPRFVELFKNVGVILSRYRSGQLPKAFKIIPKLANWEQVLWLTEPDKWTAATMLNATRIFASNLNPKMCQRFYNLVLLPRLRDDIAQYKKLNFHLYQALKKSLFKPAAFFKGMLLPLCESGCTLRECTVFASVLATCSVPMLHAAAALLKLAEMQYAPANSMFIRVLVMKRYALPYRVIDGLVHHFLRFSLDSRTFPVVFHQSLLALAENYAADISTEQKDSLLEFVRKHSHAKITPVIRKWLTSSGERDANEDMHNTDGDSKEKFISDNPDME